ncbi:MAG: hypothetical protein GXP31_05160 [Kiritimatiellaeota bacterium]|nr:hypothetical protein [Kiritimatiellota bacterium]
MSDRNSNPDTKIRRRGEKGKFRIGIFSERPSARLLAAETRILHDSSGAMPQRILFQNVTAAKPAEAVFPHGLARRPTQRRESV